MLVDFVTHFKNSENRHNLNQSQLDPLILLVVGWTMFDDDSGWKKCGWGGGGIVDVGLFVYKFKGFLRLKTPTHVEPVISST